MLFTIANLAAMLLIPDWETVPFHFIWVSLTILYGFRVWRTRPTVVVLTLVMATTGVLIYIDVTRSGQQLDELTEVPLMAAMFAAMVWHARRRLTATEEAERVSLDNVRLLERERRFVQDASHELRTPITVALGHAELIQRQATDPTVVQDAAVITDELMRLGRLVDRLLLLASSVELEVPHTVPIGMQQLVVDAVHRWTATPRHWQLGATEDLTVAADADRLAVALDAVIENAVQHTVETDTIEAGVQRRGGDAVIWIRDTGSGIAAADLDRIFDRFARSDQGRSRHTGGFGLGLPIVQAIVQGHGGSVHVQSVEGEWTRFEIALPFLRTPTTMVRDDIVLVDGDARDPVG
ncbi:MAG: HAMP domain-containing sensor histidine kinase [Actinomycetota bacterium]